MQALTFDTDVQVVVHLYNIEGTKLGESTILDLPQQTSSGDNSANYVTVMKLFRFVELNVGEPYEIVATTFKNGDQNHVMAKSTKGVQDRIFVLCQAKATTTPQTTALPAPGPTANCTNSPAAACTIDLSYLLRTSTRFAFEEFIETSSHEDGGQSYCYSTDTNGQHMCRSLGACLSFGHKSFEEDFGTHKTHFCEDIG